MSTNATWDVPAIKRAGTQLADHAEEMFNILKRAKSAVEGTQSSFKTAEGDKTRQQFEQLSGEFSKFHEDVKAFAQYINDYGSAAEQFKQEIGSTASKLPAGNR